MSESTTTQVSKERPLGEKLLYAVLILAMGDVASKALGLLISIVRTRTLTNTEFGGFGFIMQTVGMFAQIAGFSLGLAATRYVALYRATEPDKAREIAQFITWFGVITTAVAAGLMILLAPWLSVSVPGLVGSMRLSSLVLITQTLSGLFLGALVGQERFRAATIANLLQNVVMLTLTLWWTPLFGLAGTIYAMAAGFTVTLTMACWFSRDLFQGRWHSAKELWSHKKIITEFCVPSLLSGLCVLPAVWFAQSIFASQHGPDSELSAGLALLPTISLAGLGMLRVYSSGLTQLAIFYAADQLRPIVGMLANVVAQPMMPLLSAQVRHAVDPDASPEEREASRKKAQNAILRSFQLVICLILPAHAILAFAGQHIMAIFGKTFATEWNVFLAVLAWGAFAGVTSLLGIALQAQGRMWLSNLFYLFYGILLVLFALLFRNYGAMGLSFAYICTSIVSSGITCYVMLRHHLISMPSILLLAATVVWLGVISFTATLVPAGWRLAAIPFACFVTVLMLFLVMRAQMMHVARLLYRKVSGLLGRGTTSPQH